MFWAIPPREENIGLPSIAGKAGFHKEGGERGMWIEKKGWGGS